MHKARTYLVALLLMASPCAASAQLLPSEAGLRFSEQISNGPAGTCGCFNLQGAALDANWNLIHPAPNFRLGLAFDATLENTGSVNGAAYGLTLSTFTAGPRFKLSAKKVRPFAQALFGIAHGAGSQFPENGNTLASSANSFALDVGAGADYSLRKHLSIRFLQVDYLRTALPNNSTNWQNNLRIGAGLTLHISH